MIRGINQNTNPESTPPDFIYWAKNCILNNELDAGINEKGTSIPFDLLPFNIDYVCGSTTLSYYIILFYKSLSGQDCIAVINTFTNTVSIKLQRIDFNFNINSPIKAKAKFNANNELVVAFIYDSSVPKYVNLDTAQPTDSLNFYNLFPIVNSAQDIITQVINGGGVTAGAYIITFAYIARDRTRSSYTTLSNPVYVTTMDTSNFTIAEKGNKAGVSTNKAIKVTLSNIDTSYSKVSVAIISRINGVTTQKIIKEVAITDTTISFVYTGTEFLADVTLDELVSDNIRYTSAKHITSLNDELFLADLATDEVFDYQSLVNQTQVSFISTFTSISLDQLYLSAKFRDGNRKTFQHDEVYALYMQIEKTDGTFTDWFHLPGRAPNPGETSPSGLYTAGLTINGRIPYVYEIEDTSSVVTSSTSSGVTTKVGNMGFWQNDNEIYPNTSRWGALAGQKVRHHKFPSIAAGAAAYSSEPTYGIGHIDLLDIRVINAALFSRPEVKGYRIGYAKRTLADVGVSGMGLTQFWGAPEGGDNLIPDPGGDGQHFDSKTIMPVAANSLNTASGGGNDICMNRAALRFNSFDMWQDRPALSGTYLRNYIKLKANKLSELASGYAGNSQYGHRTNGGTVDMQCYAMNYGYPGTNNTTRSTPANNDKVRKLSDGSYIPNNVKLSQGGLTINNLGSEECIYARIEGTDLGINRYGFLAVNTSGSGSDPNFEEETFLSAIKNPKSDFFAGFENQTIVVGNHICRSGGSEDIISIGDAFLGIHSYATLAPYNITMDTQTDETHRIVNFKIHAGVSRHNVGMRYIVSGDYSSYFYPDGAIFNLDYPYVANYWFWTYSRKLPWNQFQYSKDYSSVTDLETFGVFVEGVPIRSKFPFRIARSTKASRDNSLDDGWKSFKAADYFDTVANKGELTNLEAWGNDILLIHHRNALFRTRDKAVLQTDTISVTLGSGDIFAIEPKEANPTNEGVGGTQHSFGCKLTDAGYIFPDAETGKVYIYDGETLQEIGKGLRLFFRKYLKCNNNNPYLKVGTDKSIVTSFDQVNNRIILSQRAGNSFTVSYSLEKQEWASAHDWIPDYIINTRNNVFLLKNNQLQTIGTGARGNYFGVTYPFYIDFIVNQEPTKQKVLNYVTFLCKVKDSVGNILPRKTISKITIWNDQSCTDVIDIVTNETESLFVDSNCKVVDEDWEFNDINDHVVDPNLPFIDTLFNDSRPIASNMENPVWYETADMRGKYFIIRLEYSNIENKEVHLRVLSPNLQASGQ